MFHERCSILRLTILLVAAMPSGPNWTPPPTKPIKKIIRLTIPTVLNGTVPFISYFPAVLSF
jgi:hypothetical protein